MFLFIDSFNRLELYRVTKRRYYTFMSIYIGVSAAVYRGEGDRYSRLNENYTRALRAAGAVPIIFPFDLDPKEAEGLVARVDGLVLSGGADLAPRLYGEEPTRGLKRVCDEHDRAELALFAAARERRMPVLGICRGCQLINVAMGGTLYQDLPSQLEGALGHAPEGAPMSQPHHRVDLEPGDSYMRRAFGARPGGAGAVYVNSFHHQAVKRLAEGLRVTARAADGVVEAAEGTAPGWYLVAVQFHPEGQAASDPGCAALFEGFTDAARDYGRRPRV